MMPSRCLTLPLAFAVVVALMPGVVAGMADARAESGAAGAEEAARLVSPAASAEIRRDAAQISVILRAAEGSVEHIRTGLRDARDVFSRLRQMEPINQENVAMARARTLRTMQQVGSRLNAVGTTHTDLATALEEISDPERREQVAGALEVIGEVIAAAGREFTRLADADAMLDLTPELRAREGLLYEMKSEAMILRLDSAMARLGWAAMVDNIAQRRTRALVTAVMDDSLRDVLESAVAAFNGVLPPAERLTRAETRAASALASFRRSADRLRRTLQIAAAETAPRGERETLRLIRARRLLGLLDAMEPQVAAHEEAIRDVAGLARTVTWNAASLWGRQLRKALRARAAHMAFANELHNELVGFQEVGGVLD